MAQGVYSGGFSPREKEWWLYSFGTSEISAAQSAGSELIVPISTIPPRQGDRWLHGVEMVIHGRFRMDTTAAGMTAILAGSQIRGIVSQVSLRDIFGHDYIRAGDADGRTVVRQMAQLYGYEPAPPVQDVPDADATDVLRDFYIPIRFRPGPRDVMNADRAWDQVMPLFLFNEKSGSAGLRLRLGSALPGSPAGITDNTVTLLEVFVRTLADEDLHTDSPWWMRTNRYTQTAFTAYCDAAAKDPMHRLLYSVIQHLPEDAQGTDLVDYGSLAVKHGEDDWISARSSAEVANLYNSILVEDGASRALQATGVTFATGFGGDPTLATTTAPTTLPLLQTRPGSLRSEWGQQPLIVSLTRNAARPDTRVLSYGNSEGLTDEYVRLVAASVGLPPGQIAVASKLAAPPTSGAPIASVRKHASVVIRTKG